MCIVQCEVRSRFADTDQEYPALAFGLFGRLLVIAGARASLTQLDCGVLRVLMCAQGAVVSREWQRPLHVLNSVRQRLIRSSCSTVGDGLLRVLVAVSHATKPLQHPACSQDFLNASAARDAGDPVLAERRSDVQVTAVGGRLAFARARTRTRSAAAFGCDVFDAARGKGGPARLVART